MEDERSFRKKTIRRIIIKKRDELDKKTKIDYDSRIKKSLMRNSLFLEADNIFIYVGFGSEINTSAYIEEFLKLQKNILIPRTEIKTRKMEAVQIQDLNDLVMDDYGILEPRSDKEIFQKEKIDLIILPGVCFSEYGDRIGYGGGYYDRYLKTLSDSIPKIALCYEFQIDNDIESEKHDVKADYIITEDRFIICK